MSVIRRQGTGRLSAANCWSFALRGPVAMVTLITSRNKQLRLLVSCGFRKNFPRFSLENLKGRGHSKYVGIGGKIILE
jgi:hypothetical protein